MTVSARAYHAIATDSDRTAIRQLMEDWVVWRDAGLWDRFQTVWHPRGRMKATWFQGSAAEFIDVSRQGMEKGVNILHFLGGHGCDVRGDRAISQTKMQIMQRAAVEGVLCDVCCTGRFYDFLERGPHGWALVQRQPIYEKDRIDPIDPAAELSLDPDLLAEFPEGYRHLAYLQTKIGYAVKKDMPGLRGAEVERLYAMGEAWLDNSLTLDELLA